MIRPGHQPGTIQALGMPGLAQTEELLPMQGKKGDARKRASSFLLSEQGLQNVYVFAPDVYALFLTPALL